MTEYFIDISHKANIQRIDDRGWFFSGKKWNMRKNNYGPYEYFEAYRLSVKDSKQMPYHRDAVVVPIPDAAVILLKGNLR